MARRADHSRDEIKTLAIAAGSTLIQEHGYTNFSARKVAAVIGYTVGTLYNVFSDQHDFILHINGVTLEGMQQHLTTIDSTIYGAERIHALATQYLIFCVYQSGSIRSGGITWAKMVCHSAGCSLT